MDESLNVIVDPELQKDLQKKSFENLQKKLTILEREKALKWKIVDSVDVINDQIKFEMESLNKEMQNMKFNIEIATDKLMKKKVSVSSSDTTKKQ